MQMYSLTACLRFSISLMLSCFHLTLSSIPVVVGREQNSLKFKNGNECPCINSDWCNPIVDIAKHEIFAFSVKNDRNHWSKYDWTKLTTVVMFGYISDELMCLAHAVKTRVAYAANTNFDFKDPTSRRQWIEKQLIFMKEHHLDGINFDYESVIAKNDSETRNAYTSLVAQTNKELKKVLPHSQVTVDVAWKQNIDQRFYDYKGLANHSDFLFVMAYDEQSQIIGECVAMPNAGLRKTMDGLTSYLANGIPAHKLVLGLPWYGYIYPCISLDRDKCLIKPVPFRGVPCSDAAGRQFDYAFIWTLSNMHTVWWNSTSSTPYFSYTKPNSSVYYQVQFDNPYSLGMKYKLAEHLKLRGVGMWNVDCLNYDDSAEGKATRAEMFGALPVY